MSIRDFLVFITFFSILPFGLVRPFIGVLLYAWVSLMNPHRLAWGPAYDFPFAMLAAAVTLLGLTTAYLRNSEEYRLPMERETKLLVVLWMLFFITTFTSLLPDVAWVEFERISKIMLMTFLIMVLINDAQKLRWLVIIVAFSIGFYGFKGGLFSIARGGQSMIWGPGGFIGGNTSLGLAMNMVLPMIFYLGRTEQKKWIKILCYLAFLLTILAVMFTYSRGAFLGLIVVLGLLLARFKMGALVAIVMLGIVSIPVAIQFVPEKFVERVESIGEYQQDGSANKRLNAWSTAWQVALARPLTGGGYQIIDDVPTAQLFNPEFTERDVGVHSVYFEVLAENGFITATVFVALMVSAIFSLRRMRKKLRDQPDHHFNDYSHMLELSIIAYAVSGTFLELASFDLFYTNLAMVVVMKALLSRQLAEDGATAKGPATPFVRVSPLRTTT